MRRLLPFVLVLAPLFASAEDLHDADVQRRFNNPEWPTMLALADEPMDPITTEVVYAMIAGIYRGWHFALVYQVELNGADPILASKARSALQECEDTLSVDSLFDRARQMAKHRPNVSLSDYLVGMLDVACADAVVQIGDASAPTKVQDAH